MGMDFKSQAPSYLKVENGVLLPTEDLKRLSLPAHANDRKGVLKPLLSAIRSHMERDPDLQSSQGLVTMVIRLTEFQANGQTRDQISKLFSQHPLRRVDRDSLVPVSREETLQLISEVDKIINPKPSRRQEVDPAITLRRFQDFVLAE